MKTFNRLALYAFVHVAMAVSLAVLTAGNVFSQADFYKGKTVKIVRGGGPG